MAFEHDDLGHGVFFHHILEGLGGKAADYSGEISFESLAAYVRKEVPRQVDDLLPGRKQLPNLMANLTGLPPVLARLTRREADNSFSEKETAPEAAGPAPNALGPAIGDSPFIGR